MDFKRKDITWVSSICQKIEAVVDDIIEEQAVKFVENQVQNVGDVVKRIYSDVVQELLPPLVNSARQGLGKKENSVNNLCNSDESCAIDGANNQQADADDSDDSREASDVLKESLHVITEQNAESSPGFDDKEFGVLAGKEKNSDLSVEQDSCAIVQENVIKSSTAEMLDSISLGERETFEASTVSESSSDGVDDDPWGILDEFATASSIVNMNSTFSPIAGTVNKDILAGRDQCATDVAESSGSLYSSEVSYSTVLSESSMGKTDPLCFKSSIVSDNLSAKSQGSYIHAFEIEPIKNKSASVSGCSFNESLVLASQAGLVSCGSCQSMESNEGETLESNEAMSSNNLSEIRQGQMCSAQKRCTISLSDIGKCKKCMKCLAFAGSDESLISSMESGMDTILLSDDAKLDESCVFVADDELYALSRQIRLRSYKKRIRDLFARKKRLAKEYEQLAIWYGDTDMDSSQGALQTLLPVRSRTSLDSKNLQLKQANEPEWELL